VNKGIQVADGGKLGAAKTAFKEADDWLKIYR
jgi:hypothetical protein